MNIHCHSKARYYVSCYRDHANKRNKEKTSHCIDSHAILIIIIVGLLVLESMKQVSVSVIVKVILI